jgi:xanthine dehydrogenase YagT iron-sulfur-binding subunit
MICKKSLVKHDGLNVLLYPGQICSSAALLERSKKWRGELVTEDLKKYKKFKFIEEEIKINACRKYLSLRCPQYRTSFKEVHSEDDVMPTWEFATAEQMKS